MCCHCEGFVPTPPTADRHDRSGRHMMLPTACNDNVQHIDLVIKEGDDSSCLLYYEFLLCNGRTGRGGTYLLSLVNVRCSLLRAQLKNVTRKY